MRKIIPLVLVLVCGSTIAFADGPGSAATDQGSALVAGPGSGSATTAPTTAGSGSAVPPDPAAAVHNPAQDPIAALDDVKLAKKTGWPIAVFVVLLMITKGLAYGAPKIVGWPVVGKLGAWLALDKHAMWVTGAGTCLAAGYNVLALGGTLVGALVAAAMAGAGLVHSTTHSSDPAAK